MANMPTLADLHDWRDRLGTEMAALCADPSSTVDGYQCATRERAEEVRSELVLDALAVCELVERRIERIKFGRAMLRTRL